jgi:hypothetical protein
MSGVNNKVAYQAPVCEEVCLENRQVLCNSLNNIVDMDFIYDDTKE